MEPVFDLDLVHFGLFSLCSILGYACYKYRETSQTKNIENYFLKGEIVGANNVCYQYSNAADRIGEMFCNIGASLEFSVFKRQSKDLKTIGQIIRCRNLYGDGGAKVCRAVDILNEIATRYQTSYYVGEKDIAYAIWIAEEVIDSIRIR